MKPTERRAKTGTLFQNPLLERLTRTNALMAIRLYYVIGLLSLVVLAAYGYLSPVLLLFVPLGLGAFTLFEYIMHRWLYHMEGESESVKKFTYTMHGVHHDYPNDADRQVLPLILAIPLAFLIFSLCYWALGPAGVPFFAGFLWGYASYLYVHYSVHVRRMPKNWTRFWWKYHSIHHYKEPNRAYGVSSPVWDYVFGTYPKGKYNW